MLLTKHKTVISDLKEIIGILDLRSLGYCKIRQGPLQQNLSKYYCFKPAETLCDYLNKFVNTLKEEKGRIKRKVPLDRQE